MIAKATPSTETRGAELAELIERLNARLQAGEPLDAERVLREHSPTAAAGSACGVRPRHGRSNSLGSSLSANLKSVKTRS